MLDREYIEEVLDTELEYLGVGIPHDIAREALIEVFCEYIEEDYKQWLRENLALFFNDGEPDWDWIRERLGSSEE
jgi:hypothetical protein